MDRWSLKKGIKIKRESPPYQGVLRMRRCSNKKFLEEKVFFGKTLNGKKKGNQLGGNG